MPLATREGCDQWRPLLRLSTAASRNEVGGRERRAYASVQMVDSVYISVVERLPVSLWLGRLAPAYELTARTRSATKAFV